LATTATSRPPGRSLVSACLTWRMSPRLCPRSTHRGTTGRSAWKRCDGWRPFTASHSSPDRHPGRCRFAVETPPVPPRASWREGGLCSVCIDHRCCAGGAERMGGMGQASALNLGYLGRHDGRQ
jgi:hypothetical protein